MECNYNGITYKEGDIIEFDDPNSPHQSKVQGILTFGEYPDAESYADYAHLGFYVIWGDDFRTTLPDALMNITERK